MCEKYEFTSLTKYSVHNWPDANSYVWHFNECLLLFQQRTESSKWIAYRNELAAQPKKGRLLFITLHHATPLQRWTVIIFVFYGTVCCCRFFLLSNDYRPVFWRNAWIQWLFLFKNVYWFQYFVRVAYKLLWPLAFWTLCWCKCASNWPKRAKINEYFAKMWNFGMTMAQAARQKGRIGSVGTAC